MSNRTVIWTENCDDVQSLYQVLEWVMRVHGKAVTLVEVLRSVGASDVVEDWDDLDLAAVLAECDANLLPGIGLEWEEDGRSAVLVRENHSSAKGHFPIDRLPRTR